MGIVVKLNMRKQNGERLGCNACAGIIDLIHKDISPGLSPLVAARKTLEEFSDIKDEQLCHEDLICLPRIRMLVEAEKKA